MIEDIGCGEGDVRGYCAAASSRSDIGSFAGTTPVLIPWNGKTEADCNQQLVAPSCLLNTSDGSFCEEASNDEVIVLIQQSSLAIIIMEDDEHVGLRLKQGLDLPNGLEDVPITTNDLALQQTFCQNSTRRIRGRLVAWCQRPTG